MKQTTLMLVRVCVGLLVLLRGIDEVAAVEHAREISYRFHTGVFRILAKD